ncbi:MAG: hypothetical protein HLX50_02135 [Alteromonadaceae bacterium]|nr:hypothetical protein [Alteromonadaceae bacterium]
MVRKLVLAAAISSFSAGALAQGAGPMKHFSVGLASYASSLGYTLTERYDSSYYWGYRESSETETFSGPALFITGAINNNFALRGTYAMQGHEDESWDLDSLEGSLLAGTGLAENGLRAYGSVGFFRDSFEYSTYDSSSEKETFSGLALGGGVGYTWTHLALEFWLNVRSAADYEDFLEDYAHETSEHGAEIDDVVAVTGGLGLSVRF